MRASTTQKAYDEAFLACSTAVYFEGQVGQPTHLSRTYELYADHTIIEQRARSSSFVEDCARSHLLP